MLGRHLLRAAQPGRCRLRCSRALRPLWRQEDAVMGGGADGLQREEARRWLLVLLPCLIRLLSVALAHAAARGDVVGLRGREWLFAVLRRLGSLPCPRALLLPRQRVVAVTSGGEVLQQPGEVRCWIRGPSAAVLHAAAAGDVGREGERGEGGVAEGDEVAFCGAGVTASPTQPPGPTSAEPVRGRGRGRGGRATAARRGAVLASWPPAAVMHSAAACVDCRESGRAGGGGGEGDGVAFRGAGVTASRTLPPGPTFIAPVRLQWLFKTNAS